MNTKEHEDLIVDRFGRRFRNLRVSLTAACNYACTYCVPDGKKLQAASYELSSDEMIRAVSLYQDMTARDKSLQDIVSEDSQRQSEQSDPGTASTVRNNPSFVHPLGASQRERIEKSRR